MFIILFFAFFILFYSLEVLIYEFYNHKTIRYHSRFNYRLELIKRGLL